MNEVCRTFQRNYMVPTENKIFGFNVYITFGHNHNKKYQVFYPKDFSAEERRHATGVMVCLYGNIAN